MNKPFALKSGGFVIRAKAVRGAGGGSAEEGLKKLKKSFGAKPIRGSGSGTSDSIPAKIDGKHPARVSNKEAYISPKRVREAGGAKKLQAMQTKLARKAR